jgi:hypothetical protein
MSVCGHECGFGCVDVGGCACKCECVDVGAGVVLGVWVWVSVWVDVHASVSMRVLCVGGEGGYEHASIMSVWGCVGVGVCACKCECECFVCGGGEWV